MTYKAKASTRFCSSGPLARKRLQFACAAALGMSAVAHADSIRELNTQGDPTGITSAAVNDADHFAWNTMLSVPATGNSVSYEFDVATGLPNRVQNSLGPLFTSRALTIGEGRFSFNASAAYFEFVEYDGIDLGNGEVTIPVATPFGVGQNTTLVQNASSLVTQVSATYGVTSALDVSVSVPVLSNDTDLLSRLTLGGVPVLESRGSVNKTTIGDVFARAKWAFMQRNHFLMAAEAGVWFPTGDADNFIGLEQFRFEPWLIFSTKDFPVNFHVNVGASVGETSRLRNEFRYKIGGDWRALQRVTVSAELLGRHVMDNDRILITSSAFGITGEADSHYNDAALGLKWNPIGDIVLSGSAIIALDDTGPRDPLVGIIGVEFNF